MRFMVFTLSGEAGADAALKWRGAPEFRDMESSDTDSDRH
jgi:hypothetical protein